MKAEPSLCNRNYDCPISKPNQFTLCPPSECASVLRIIHYKLCIQFCLQHVMLNRHCISRQTDRAQIQPARWAYTDNTILLQTQYCNISFCGRDCLSCISCASFYTMLL
ncbi:unnamed protein product [Parnassius mnemosyne]|uniref:Uncharacterized protein n=1 Tax=Parnassius mnemosyne TaxID=213953 RepID=A0AAV1L2F6_9NEOP